MLYRIVYCSRIDLPGSSGDLESAIHAILAVSRRNNQLSGVTGALLFTNQSFAQVLEGERDSVEAIYEKIRLDPRHSRVMALERAYQLERHFAQWAMAYADTQSIHMLPGISRDLEDLYTRSKGVGSRIVELLSGVVNAYPQPVDEADASSALVSSRPWFNTGRYSARTRPWPVR